jgi:hypothetical protein
MTRHQLERLEQQSTGHRWERKEKQMADHQLEKMGLREQNQ